MTAALAIARKDLRLLLRDRPALIFVLLVPLLFAVFFGVVFSGQGGGGRIGIAVVDSDRSEGSARFIDDLRADAALDVLVVDDAESARRLVQTGRRTAFVELHRGFGQARSRPFSGDTARITVGIDPARRAEGAMLEGLLTEHLFSRLADTFTDRSLALEQINASRTAVAEDPGINPLVRSSLLAFLDSAESLFDTLPEGSDSNGTGWQPFAIERADIALDRSGTPPSAFAVSFPQAMVWALIGSVMTFAASLVVERTRGTFPRICTAPVSKGTILLGKGLACFITASLVLALLTALAATPMFGVRPRSPALMAVVIPSVAFGFVGLMMLIAVLGRTEAAVSGIGWGLMMPLALLGGGMVPRFLLPSWMDTAGVVSPVRWASVALEGAIWRPNAAVHTLLACAVLVLIGLAGSLLGGAILARTR